MAIMFSAHVRGSWTTLRIASHTPLRGSIHTLKGSRRTYSQAMKKPTGHPRNSRMMNHRMAHRMPAPPLPDAILERVYGGEERGPEEYRTVTHLVG